MLRTFSKAYGLAGLRVGYAIARPQVAEAIRKASPPFAVTICPRPLRSPRSTREAALAERVEAIVQERARAWSRLCATRAGTLPETQANFVWLPLGDDAMDFAAWCAPVSVRPFAGDGVRVSVGSPAVNATFLDRAAAWRKEH